MSGPGAARRRAAVWAVFALALAARLIFVWRQGAPQPPAGDALGYQRYAVSLLESGRYEGLQGERGSRMPGYPLFLAAVYGAWGPAPAAALWAQCLLGALTCVLLLGLARALLPPPWPLFCAAAAALSYDLIAACGALLSETLYSFLLVLSLRLLFERRRPPRWRALAYGAAAGAVYLVRPEPLPALLVVAAALPWLLPRFGRAEAVRALAALGLAVALWTTRNALVFGRFVPASTVGRQVAYLGLYLPYESRGLGPRHQPPPGLAELERDADYGAAYRALASRLSLGQRVKARLFNVLSALYPFLPAYDWTYAALVPFWLLGLWAARRRRELWPAAAVVLGSLLVFAFFGGPVSRYRQGFYPLLVLLAGAGLQACARRAGPRRLRLWAGGWLGVNLLVWAFQAQVRAGALGLKALVFG